VNLAYPTFTEHEIEIPRYGLSYRPWGAWSSSGSPFWWGKGYDKIKHERDRYFENANLENAIMATAGLLCTLMYYYEELRVKRSIPLRVELSQFPKLLSPKDYGPWQGADILWGYSFPPRGGG
jgi:hypothetical protein